ncbi:MAG: reverse transcriptase domain-containing protein [Turicibacter sp.]
MRKLLQCKTSGLNGVAHLNQSALLCELERIYNWSTQLSQRYTGFRKFEEMEQASLNEAKNMFRQLKGLKRTCSQTEQSDSAGSILQQMLSQFFMERIEATELQRLGNLATQLQSGVQAAKKNIAAAMVKELEFVFENYDYVLAIKLVGICMDSRVDISPDIINSVLHTARNMQDAIAGLKLGNSEKEESQTQITSNKNTLEPSIRQKLKTKVQGKSKNPKSLNKFSKKYFSCSKNYSFNIKFNKSKLNNINNISLDEIPANILKLLSLGGNFIYQKINKNQSICNFLKMKNQIENHLITMKLDTKYLNNLSVIYSNRIEKSCDRKDFREKLFKPVTDFLISKNLIIKNADKNMGLTIMPLTWYNNQVMAHLNDQTTYEEVESIDLFRIWSELSFAINDLKKLPFKPERLKEKSFEVPKFYVMPKLHKNPVKTRPIVPNYNWVTTEVAIWLHKQLWPYVKNCEWIVENSLQVVKEVDELNLIENPLIYSIDVESMYTNIDIGEGLRTIRKLLLLKGCDNYLSIVIIRLLSWVLRNNYFMYDNKSYKQVKGTAMGSNVAPSFANLFMLFYELKMFEVIEKPILYKRYLDDILIVCNSEENFKLMFEYMQNMTPSLKFTYVRAVKKLNFLDLSIYLVDPILQPGLLAYNLYQKPDKRELYLHPDSEVKNSIKFGWITGENIRLLRNSSCKRAYKKSMKDFIIELEANGYTYNVIKKYVKYSYKHRHLVFQTLEKKDLSTAKFIVMESDSCSKLYNEFTRKINLFYEMNIIVVEKNYNKLIDDLNRASMKVLEEVSSKTSKNV